MRFGRIAAFAAAVLCAAPAAAAPPDDLAAQLGDTHFGVYAKGRRVGTVADSLAARGAGADAHYVFTSETRVRHRRGAPPTPTRFSFRAEFEGRPPYALRLATYSEFDRGPPRSVAVEHAGVGYDTVVSQAGETHRFPSAVTGYTLRDCAAMGAWLRGPPPAGATLAVNEILWYEARPDPLTLRFLGRAGAVDEVEATNSRGRAWLGRFDPVSGDGLGYVFPSGDEYRAEPPDPARPLEEPEPWPEAMSVVPADRPLGAGPHPWLRLTLRGYTGTGLRSGPGQTVEPRGEGVWACRLGKGEGTPLPATDDDSRAALTETPRFPFRHPKVVELARRVVGPAAKLVAEVRFVHTHLRYELNEAPELFELLQTRRGNCQSFGLLFVALARAADLPAREVDGLMYTGDDPPGFGWHRWAEVAVDGVWHPVDATGGFATLDATYLRLDEWADGMTLTVDEVAWTGGLRGLSVRAVVRWLGQNPVGCVAAGLLAAVVTYRIRRMIRRSAHRDAPHAGTDGPGA